MNEMSPNTLSKCLTIALILSLCSSAFAHAQDLYESPYRYAFLAYTGAMTRNTLGQVVGGECELDKEHLYSIEFSYLFKPEQGIRRYFSLIFQSIEGNFNMTYHDDHGRSIYEFIPYLSFRWKKFPWDNVLKTSISLGEGVSWVSNVSTREHRNSEDPQKILNYLNFELTAALAAYPQIELVGRIHHRSGVFGLYHSTNSGSSAVGLGLRWYFDKQPS